MDPLIGQPAADTAHQQDNLPTREEWIQHKLLPVNTLRMRKSVPDSCPICYENYQLFDKIVYTAECNHFFHSTCVLQWFNDEDLPNTNTCPICRRALFQPPLSLGLFASDEEMFAWLDEAVENVSDLVSEAVPFALLSLQEEQRDSPQEHLRALLPLITDYVLHHLSVTWHLCTPSLEFAVTSAVLNEVSPPLDIFFNMLRYRNDRIHYHLDSFRHRQRLMEAVACILHEPAATSIPMPGPAGRVQQLPGSMPGAFSPVGTVPTSITVRLGTGTGAETKTYPYRVGEDVVVPVLSTDAYGQPLEDFPNVILSCGWAPELGFRHMVGITKLGIEDVEEWRVDEDTLFLRLKNAGQDETLTVTFNYDERRDGFGGEAQVEVPLLNRLVGRLGDWLVERGRAISRRGAERRMLAESRG